MKKLIVIAILLVTAVTGYAQELDNFVVGPYEVEYRGEGDFKFRLRRGIDLYEYYGLEKDTIIQKVVEKRKPLKSGIQVDAFMSMPRFVINGNSNIFGVSGAWKQQIGKNIYLNTGLSLGVMYGKYNFEVEEIPYHRDDVMLEVGVPVSVEFSAIDYKKASLFAAVGLVPTFYSTMSVDEVTADGVPVDGEKESGILVSPRVDLGGYFPLDNMILRLGVYGEYKIDCSGDAYKDRIGRAFIGANIGVVF